MLSTIKRRLRELIREIVAAELQQSYVIVEDPLAADAERTKALRSRLAEGANSVGQDVIVGRDVVIWGGRGASCVGVQIGDRVRIYDHSRLVVDHLSADSGIVLGDDVALNFGCYIEGSGGVRIGRGTIFGPHAIVVSSAHRIVPGVPVRASGKVLAPVTIGADVWIGAAAVVRGGVTIGDAAVVGAGAIVTHDVAPGTIVAGNPARLLSGGVDS